MKSEAEDFIKIIEKIKEKNEMLFYELSHWYDQHIKNSLEKIERLENKSNNMINVRNKDYLELQKIKHDIHDYEIKAENFVWKESKKIAEQYLNEINHIAVNLYSHPRVYGFLCLIGGKRFIRWWTKDLTNERIKEGMIALEFTSQEASKN